PGNDGGGRTRTEAQKHRDQLIDENTSDQDVIEVWDSIKSFAKAGSAEHQKIFLDRLQDKVPQRIQVAQEENTVYDIQWGNRSELTDGSNGATDTLALSPSTDGESR